jgi:hypothetical protein
VPHVREANVGLSPTTRTNDPADNETDNGATLESSAGGAAVNSPGRKPGVARGPQQSGRVSGPTALPKAVAGARSAQATNKEIFRAFATAGQRLAELHVKYEEQPDATQPTVPHVREANVGMSPTWLENPQGKLDYRVSKMRLGKDKTSLFYNDYWTLTHIPAEVYEYRLGNRSALDWIVDQYQVSTDKRSGITNDPNREDDPEYIKRLIGQVIYVSLETVKIINALPELVIADPPKAEAATQ